MTVAHVKKFDLLTHVKFCRVPQRVCAFDDARHNEEHEEHWRIQCSMNGLAYVEIRDIRTDLMSWKEISKLPNMQTLAMDSVAHSCTLNPLGHPDKDLSLSLSIL